MPGEGSDDLPDWLPLYIVDSGFAERLANAHEHAEQLMERIETGRIDEDKLLEALKHAISVYWEDEHDHDHYRFIRFIFERAKLHGWESDLSRARGLSCARI